MPRLQTALTRDLRLVRGGGGGPDDGGAIGRTVRRMKGLLVDEGPLAFSAVVGHGSVLKCISELLMRCAPHVPVSGAPPAPPRRAPRRADGRRSGRRVRGLRCRSRSLRARTGLGANDPTSGRLVHIVLQSADLLILSRNNPGSVGVLRKSVVFLPQTWAPQFSGLSGERDRSTNSVATIPCAANVRRRAVRRGPTGASTLESNSLHAAHGRAKKKRPSLALCSTNSKKRTYSGNGCIHRTFPGCSFALRNVGERGVRAVAHPRAPLPGRFGSLVAPARGGYNHAARRRHYSGQQRHTKHSTISVHHPAQATEYVIPDDYRTEGVLVPSNILRVGNGVRTARRSTPTAHPPRIQKARRDGLVFRLRRSEQTDRAPWQRYLHPFVDGRARQSAPIGQSFLQRRRRDGRPARRRHRRRSEHQHPGTICHCLPTTPGLSDQNIKQWLAWDAF